MREVAQENILKKQKEVGLNTDAYTKESRVQMYEEMQAKKIEDDKKSKENSMFKDYHDFEEGLHRKEPITVYNPQGEIR